MSKLNVDQQTIKRLFEDKKSDFLIPDYQRPYAWTTTECQTLRDDIFSFAFPEDDYKKFDSSNDEYFLGPIVTFKNEDGKMEIIDGQQRLTTLMLLLRAFYEKYGKMKDDDAVKTSSIIEKCIWKTDEFDRPNKSELKIDSEVATDNDKEEFLNILKSGVVTKDQKSSYAVNYRFFQEQIDKFVSEYPSYFAYLPIRILNNCILLPIEAESQDTALRIFSTLNDRGKPLSDSDIFKAQFYKYYNSQGRKNEFIEQWKELEELSDKIFHPIGGTPMDELFSRYMYYERAKQGIKSSTTEGLRKFYEKDSYKLLKNEETFKNMVVLANFWKDVAAQNEERFSERILRQLFVLNYAPNSMWTYFVSVFFMQNKDDKNLLDDEAFYKFLDKSIAFIWTYAITNPGVNALRTPVYAEMVNIVNDKPITFDEFKFEEVKVRNSFSNFGFYNARPITKSMITWWAFRDSEQKLPNLDTIFEIEHIFAKKRQESERSLKNGKNIEALGNKALLEKRINIRASDYRFIDKTRYYKGYVNTRNQKKEGTIIYELLNMASTRTDFEEKDIETRTEAMFDGFIDYLKMNDLIKE